MQSEAWDPKISVLFLSASSLIFTSISSLPSSKVCLCPKRKGERSHLSRDHIGRRGRAGSPMLVWWTATTNFSLKLRKGSESSPLNPVGMKPQPVTLFPICGRTLDKTWSVWCKAGPNKPSLFLNMTHKLYCVVRIFYLNSLKPTQL